MLSVKGLDPTTLKDASLLSVKGLDPTTLKDASFFERLAAFAVGLKSSKTGFSLWQAKLIASPLSWNAVKMA